MIVKNYEGWLGPFDYEHKNPPAPFNPRYKPHSIMIREKVTISLEADNYYSGHTKEECALEWRKRYDQFIFDYERSMQK